MNVFITTVVMIVIANYSSSYVLNNKSYRSLQSNRYRTSTYLDAKSTTSITGGDKKIKVEKKVKVDNNNVKVSKVNENSVVVDKKIVVDDNVKVDKIVKVEDSVKGNGKGNSKDDKIVSYSY